MKNTASKIKYFETWNYNTMKDLVLDIEKRHADKPAFSYRKKPSDKERIVKSYRDLAADVKCLAEALSKRGLEKSRAAVVGKLSYGWVCVYLALLSTGGVAVPLDPDWDAAELAATAKSAGCAALFCSKEIYDSKSEALLSESGIAFLSVIDSDDAEPSLFSLIAEGRLLRGLGERAFESSEPDPDVMALLVYTSGTTGKGKGVMLSQRAILTDVSNGKMYLDATGKTVGVLPPHHTFGTTVSLLSALMIGNETYISSGLRHFPRELKEEKPDYLILVPLYLETFYRKIMSTIIDSGQLRMLRRMMGVSRNLKKVKVDMRRVFFKNVLEPFGGKLSFVITGGAPISQEIIDFYEAVGINVINGYGITECAPLIACNTNDVKKSRSVGLPIPCCDVKIKDADENGEGEICVKGDNVMIGYYNDPAATAAAFGEDGYFLTGDYGKFDDDGFLYITGRLKNLIILSNGKNVYPEEIESELSNIPGILDVVVYEGVSRRGAEHNAIVAEIYADDEFMKKNGIEDKYGYFKKHIEVYNREAVRYKRIGVIKVRDADFPKNTLRKITRFKIDMSID